MAEAVTSAPTIRRQAWVSLLLTVGIWAIFSFPLPLRMAESIPSHTRRPGAVERAMIPGDHLQLAYHFWLMSDFLRGETPWFSNRYEFNTGDDEARRRVNSYFVPFSLVFAAGDAVGGRALGWNLAVLTSLWIGFWAAWRLARLFVPAEFPALCAGLAALALPYRWAGLCDGSPTGFAMMWVPVVFFLAARAILRENRRDAVCTGLAVLGLALGETQCAYLTLLALPGWIVVVTLWSLADGRAPARETLLTLVRRLVWMLPGLVAATAFLVYRNAPIRDSVMKNGRTMAEVAIFSPEPAGFVAWGSQGLGDDLYVSLLIPVALAWLLVRGMARLTSRWGQERFRGAALILLAVGCLLAAHLALGPHGWREGALFEAARRWVPKFDAIRQPMKLMSLCTALLPVVVAMALHRRRGADVRTGALAAVFALAFVAHGKVSPTLCRLDTGNRAYAAVAEDCDRAGKDRRVLALPLWPGDSAWSSLYQHYNSLYRIKGVNGYSPLVPWQYVMEVFQPLRTLNQGYLSDGQIARLGQMGVHHLVLHEDAFPEKVSPWPVGATLARLRAHPRLEELAQDGPMHAFRILPVPRADAPALALPRIPFPTRMVGAEAGWPAEERAKMTEDATATGRRCVTLTPSARPLELPVFHPGSTPGLRWRLRVKGEGTLRVVMRLGGRQTFTPGSTTPSGYVDFRLALPVDLPVASTTWTWVDAPFQPDEPGPSSALVSAVAGACQVDDLYLAAGAELTLAPGESLTLPAADFFHAGHSTPAGQVVFRAGRDPVDTVLYGPRLPLAPGAHTLRFQASAGAAALSWKNAGPDGQARLDGSSTLWPSAELRFDGSADATVDTITLRREP